MPDIDDIDQLSTDVEPASLDPLADLPLTVSSREEILNYGSADDDDGPTTVLSARVPESWVAIIDDIRQTPGTPFPSLWDRRGKFLRWAIKRGMREANAYIRAQKGLEPNDPIAGAHIFADHMMGMLRARADIVNKAHSTINDMSEGVAALLADNELDEAASFIEEYMNGVETQAPFWQSYFVKLFLENASLAQAVDRLWRGGMLRDGLLIRSAILQGITTEATDTDT